MNWVDVLGGLLAYNSVQEWRSQRERAKLIAAGWIPPERLPFVAEDAWQATEDVMIDGYGAALGAAQNAPDPMAVHSVMVSWARDAVPRLTRLRRTFEDIIVSSGAGPGNLAYDLFFGAYSTVGSLWLPAAQRIANAICVRSSATPSTSVASAPGRTPVARRWSRRRSGTRSRSSAPGTLGGIGGRCPDGRTPWRPSSRAPRVVAA